MTSIDYNHIIANGITLSTSGSSGVPKSFFQSPKKIRASIEASLYALYINQDSKIYNVCSPTWAGGLFVMTMPGMNVGAEVVYEPFNPYEWTRRINGYTHSCLSAKQALIITKTKEFYNLNLDGIKISCGAEPVLWEVIEAFVDRGATFIPNWGMTEVGPLAIYSVFSNIDAVREAKNEAPPNSTIIGDQKFCDYKVIDNELYVKGDICVFDDWYATGDTVIVQNDTLYYTGRKNMEVDFWNPKKG